MAVPAGVLADLVVVKSSFSLGGLEGFLDRPAGAGDPDQFGQRDPVRAVANEVSQFDRVFQGPAGQQPVFSAFGACIS